MDDAKEHLGGLARLQGGGLDLQEELQADGPGVGSKEAAVQPAADARDFADEAELIEDAEQQAAMADVAAAMHQHQLGLVSAALQAGAAAEDENYDFDEEEPRVRRQAAELAREEQTEVGPGDEEALLQAADIEVPAGEEAEQDDQELPLPLLVNPTPKLAPQGSTSHSLCCCNSSMKRSSHIGASEIQA
ncbi:hypothetical protein CHLNCDRAFT_140181 [Chlorella variabilis]|uniref:Uncharacterized protein n=1 Tax=Chlorella variabilis TaxID=554065 RepID=E1ZRQ2_CHLVA|nr:hypothetical protein CHLNCDRAFT_140181 [Chlorella variabilis]EFN51449.1 hypothetical protein CHLNCDRAFT_140181 [Chlorella variabilis]|eukprot:XP_005843551.1 hypothetical protein CHLNCDRAFT_140181 [Chlorella variabilis]